MAYHWHDLWPHLDHHPLCPLVLTVSCLPASHLLAPLIHSLCYKMFHSPLLPNKPYCCQDKAPCSYLGFQDRTSTLLCTHLCSPAATLRWSPFILKVKTCSPTPPPGLSGLWASLNAVPSAWNTLPLTNSCPDLQLSASALLTPGSLPWIRHHTPSLGVSAPIPSHSPCRVTVPGEL